MLLVASVAGGQTAVNHVSLGDKEYVAMNASAAKYRPLKFGVTRVTLRDGADGVRYMKAEQPLPHPYTSMTRKEMQECIDFVRGLAAYQGSTPALSAPEPSTALLVRSAIRRNTPACSAS